MQNWQKDRNDRKFKTSDGTTASIITVDGVDVKVCDEVYAVYAQS
jgi:hypothetical protein